MKAFNSKTGRYIGEIKSETGAEYAVLNPFGQEISIAKSLVILDEARAKKLAEEGQADPHERAMNEALNSRDFAGDSYRNAKLYFLIAFLVFSGALGMILLSNLMGLKGPPFVGWAMIAGVGFMFTNGLRILKYRRRLKK